MLSRLDAGGVLLALEPRERRQLGGSGLSCTDQNRVFTHQQGQKFHYYIILKTVKTFGASLYFCLSCICWDILPSLIKHYLFPSTKGHIMQSILYISENHAQHYEPASCALQKTNPILNIFPSNSSSSWTRHLFLLSILIIIQ